MINPKGALILDGITDAELIKILEVKEKHEKTVDFQPQGIKPQPGPATGPNAGRKYHNDVRLDCREHDGLKAAHEILGRLLEEHQPQ